MVFRSYTLGFVVWLTGHWRWNPGLDALVAPWWHDGLFFRSLSSQVQCMNLISIKLVPCHVLLLLYGDRESCHVFLPLSPDVQIVLVHSVKVLFLMTVYPPSCIIIIVC